MAATERAATRPAAQDASRFEEDPSLLLEAIDLSKVYRAPRTLFGTPPAPVKAVDGVSFFIREGETLGLVGESGCGKSTLARMLVRLTEPSSGRIFFRSRQLGTAGDLRGRIVDLTALDRRSLHAVRREIQMIFQEPVASLTPHLRVEELLREPFTLHPTGLSPSEVEAEIDLLMRRVGLRPGDRRRYPSQLSGGQCQRVGIARALALRPRLIVADEPVSALDVSVQGQVLNLLCDLQEESGLAYLFISHDLSVVRHLSDRIAVMYLGKLVETAPAGALYRAPKHPYTEALLSAAPVPDPGLRRRRIHLKGAPPSPAHPPPGCPFHPRCPYATSGRRIRTCARVPPALRKIGADRWVACHFAEELSLRGLQA